MTGTVLRVWGEGDDASDDEWGACCELAWDEPTLTVRMHPVGPVGYFAENEVELTAGLQPFTQLLSLDLSHNNVEELAQLPSAMLHLNASYNRVQSVEGVRGLTQLVELNLGLG